MRWTTFAAAILITPGLALAEAGHGGGHSHGGGHAHAMPAVGEPGDPAEAERTIEVEMRDNEYDREQIRVHEGETVRFVIHNRGQLVHEFNIATRDMHRAHQEEMLDMMRSGAMTPTDVNEGHGHSGGMAHDDPNSVLLEPGDSAELVWKFGERAGELEFACNVPGHYQAGMVGHFHGAAH